MIIDQILSLSKKLSGPFPYNDCRLLLAQSRELAVEGNGARYEDLIPDLDAYFYLVESHSSGVTNLQSWSVSKLSVSQSLLKASFFQTHRKYRDLEWMINEINTPQLYLMLMVSNELRVMLQKLISDLIEESKRFSLKRQQELLPA